MKQADLLADIYRNNRESPIWHFMPNPERERHERNMVIFRVRAEGPNRARMVARQLNRQIAMKLNPCLRVQKFIMHIATGPNRAFLLREQIEMVKTLTVDSPIQNHWGEAEINERVALGQSLELTIILWVTSSRFVSKS